MRYADIHTHILFGVDDGPSDIEEMRKLIELSYEDGARILCATPHMRPEFWGDPSEAVKRAFAEAGSYVQQTFPDMQLFLGSEIRYHQNCLQWIQEGRCSSINGGRYILLEFSDQVIPEQITDGCRRVLQKGFIPVIAHIERYVKIRKKTALIEQLKNYGCVIQIDAESFSGEADFFMRLASKKILKNRLADIVASDCHDQKRRPPGLSKAYQSVCEEYGATYAEQLFWNNPQAVLFGNRIGGLQ